MALAIMKFIIGYLAISMYIQLLKDTWGALRVVRSGKPTHQDKIMLGIYVGLALLPFIGFLQLYNSAK